MFVDFFGSRQKFDLTAYDYSDVLKNPLSGSSLSNRLMDHLTPEGDKVNIIRKDNQKKMFD